jgi:hypothetical protein
MAMKQTAIQVCTAMAEENEFKYKSHARCAHPRRIAWRYAQIAADYAVAADGIDTYLMPTEHGFAHEKKTREHGGLYWQDIEQADGKHVRQYFPNYLNRFADTFRPDDDGIKSLGSILADLGRSEDAEAFLFEAQLL